MNKNINGFTIVELLVVISTIVILATITTVYYNSVKNNASVSAMRSETADVRKQIDIYQTRNNNNYPNSVTDCPTPSDGNMCLTASKNGDFYYEQIPASHSGSRTVELPSFALGIFRDNSLYLHSSSEITSSNEFMRYIDLAPVIDRYGLVKYQLSFDIKSANTSSRSTINAYMQNGSGSRYSFFVPVPVTTKYVRQTITFTPTLSNASLSASMLAFYGDYHTGNIPSVKNVELTLAP